MNDNNNTKIQNIKLQLKNLESQFDNLEIQMNNLMMGWKIDNQIENLGVQLINLGIQTFNLYKQMPVLRTNEEENQFNKNIEIIIQQIKNLSFPEKINQINNNMNFIGNNMINQNIMNPPNMNQPMIIPMMAGIGIPLGMNNNNLMNNNPMMNSNNLELDDTTGIQSPIFNALNSNENANSDEDTGIQNPVFKMMIANENREQGIGLNNPPLIIPNNSGLDDTESQDPDPLFKKIKITFKRTNGQEKTKYYSYFKTKISDMLRNYIIEENLKLDTTFLFNGSKLSKLNQSYICDILSDGSVILVLS